VLTTLPDKAAIMRLQGSAMGRKTPEEPLPDDEPATGGDPRMADSVRQSAQQIWLAGMGAFAKAQQEGTKVFESLVKEGSGFQQRTQAAAEERFGDVAGKMAAMASEMSNKAGASWDKLESLFETRTAKAMARLGVPTAEDLAAIGERLDRLEAQINSLVKRAPKAPALRAAKSSAAKSPAAKAPTSATRAGSSRRTAKKPDQAR
jgi:poly(hydroxyalkanoate) granule-associated protein